MKWHSYLNLKGRDGADRIADGNREGDDDGDGDAMPMLRLEDDNDDARQGFLPRVLESRDSEIGNTSPRPPPLRGAAAVEVGLDGRRSSLHLLLLCALPLSSCLISLGFLSQKSGSSSAKSAPSKAELGDAFEAA